MMRFGPSTRFLTLATWVFLVGCIDSTAITHPPSNSTAPIVTPASPSSTASSPSASTQPTETKPSGTPSPPNETSAPSPSTRPTDTKPSRPPRFGEDPIRYNLSLEGGQQTNYWDDAGRLHVYGIITNANRSHGAAHVYIGALCYDVLGRLAHSGNRTSPLVPVIAPGSDAPFHLIIDGAGQDCDEPRVQVLSADSTDVEIRYRGPLYPSGEQYLKPLSDGSYAFVTSVTNRGDRPLSEVSVAVYQRGTDGSMADATVIHEIPQNATVDFGLRLQGNIGEARSAGTWFFNASLAP